MAVPFMCRNVTAVRYRAAFASPGWVTTAKTSAVSGDPQEIPQTRQARFCGADDMVS